MSDDLDKLFGDFDKRKQEEKEAAEAAEANRKKLREETTAILESVVRPALQDLAEAINTKGHRAEVRERSGNYSYPSVSLAFFPNASEQRYPSESTIEFLHTDGGQIKIDQKIQSADKSPARSVHDYSTNSHWKLNTVSQEKVRERAMQFIAAVLKVN